MQRTQKSRQNIEPKTQYQNMGFTFVFFDPLSSVLSGSFVPPRRDHAKATMFSVSVPSQRGGFILLFASLIASVLLTIGIGIGTIVLKELKLSSIGRESQIAFFAADTGIECALYWNEPSRDKFNKDTQSNSIACAGQTISSGTTNPSAPSGATTVIGGQTISQFGINPISSIDDSCVDVTVEKRDTGATVIIARGYNTCASDNRRVERALRVRVAPLPPEN